MLESPTLLLRPWLTDPASLTERCWIVDPTSTELLGSAVRRRAPRWNRWFRRPLVSVFESDDEPLLLTLRQGWPPWPSWSVRDAEDRLVGTVRQRQLLNADGQPLGILAEDNYRDDHSELALLEYEEEAVRLTFRLGRANNPFVRMVLLAAALVHHEDHLVQAEEARSTTGRTLAARR